MENPRVTIIEASAGSGKTQRLTLEFLTALYRLFLVKAEEGAMSSEPGQRLSSILAITFSRKAANEMIERILEKLKLLSFACAGLELAPADKEFLVKLAGKTGISAAMLKEHASRLLETIINHFSDFNVKTIDALMSGIIKVISPDLNLPAHYEIQINAAAELAEKARSFLAEMADDHWPEMKGSLEEYKASLGLSHWDIAAVISEQLIQQFQRSWKKEEDFLSQPEAGDFSRDNMELLSRCRAELSALKTTIEQHFAGTKFLNGRIVTRKTLSFLDKLLTCPDMSFVHTLAVSSFLQHHEPSYFFSVEKSENPTVRDFSRQFRHCRDLIAQIVENHSRQRVLHTRRLLSSFAEYWQQDKRRIYVEEFSRTIREKIRQWEKEALPYLFLKLSERFRYFLFDEFQDTSLLQFQALAPIMTEVLDSDPQAALLLVGDRKQAIYRWRGGSAELMEPAKLQAELQPMDFRLECLQTNFRSAPAIVAFNNSFWTPRNIAAAVYAQPEAEHLPVAALFAGSNQERPQEENGTGYPGYVEIRSISESAEENDTDKKQLLQEILCLLQRLVDKGYSGSDIAILTRKKSQGREIIDFLSRNQVEIVSDESLYLSASPILNEAVAFMRFLEYPPDDLSFYSFGNGVMLRQAAARLFPEEWAAFYANTAWPSRKERGAKHLYQMVRASFPQIWEHFIQPFFRSSGFITPYDLFQDIDERFRLFEHFPDSASFLLTFANYLHELEARNINSISSFLPEWEAMTTSESPLSIELAEGFAKVRIMTMHKAKGLEFPVVIVPLFPEKGAKQDPLLVEEGLVYHVTSKYACFSDRLQAIWRREQENRWIDELNLLYVSFTRARDVLFVPAVIAKKAKERANEFQVFKHFPAFMRRHPAVQGLMASPGNQAITWGKFIEKKYRPSFSCLPEPLALPSKIVSTWQWQKEFLVFVYSAGQKTAEKQSAERGERLHSLLAHIKFVSAKEAVPGLVNEIVARYGGSTADAEALTRFLTDDAIRPFFQLPGLVSSEREICRYHPQLSQFLRLDRLIEDEGNLTLIEFKTGFENEGHVEQLAAYCQALRGIFPHSALRAFLLYIDLMKVKELPC